MSNNVTPANCDTIEFEILEREARHILDTHPYGKRYTADETKIVHTWYARRVASNKEARQARKEQRQIERDARVTKKLDAKEAREEATREQLEKRLRKLEEEASKIREALTK